MTPERTMDADHAGMVTDACRALVAAQDSTHEGVRILAGNAALIMDEIDALRAEVSRLTAERDEAQRDATFGTPAFQEALAASEARVSRLLEALVRIKMIANAGQKYKAGPISPKAVHAIADAALAETEDSNG